LPCNSNFNQKWVSPSNKMAIYHNARNFETQITLITQIDSGCENQCNLCLH
jgi:tRNA A37 methylthiotransferase MiaB